MRVKKDYRNKEKLTALRSQYSIREIGVLYGVSGNAIWLWLKKFGIEAKAENEGLSQSQKMIQDLGDLGLSPKEIAQLTGIHVSQIYRIKRGDNKCPQSSTIRKLAKVNDKIDWKKTEANSTNLDIR